MTSNSSDAFDLEALLDQALSTPKANGNGAAGTVEIPSSASDIPAWQQIEQLKRDLVKATESVPQINSLDKVENSHAIENIAPASQNDDLLIPPPPVPVMDSNVATSNADFFNTDEMLNEVVAATNLDRGVAESKPVLKSYDFPHKTASSVKEESSSVIELENISVGPAAAISLANEDKVDDLLAAEFDFDDEPSYASVTSSRSEASFEVQMPPAAAIPPQPIAPPQAAPQVQMPPAAAIPPQPIAPPQAAPQVQMPPAAAIPPQPVAPLRVAPQVSANGNGQPNTVSLPNTGSNESISVEVSMSNTFGEDLKYMNQQHAENEKSKPEPEPEFRTQSFILRSDNNKKKGRKR